MQDVVLLEAFLSSLSNPFYIILFPFLLYFQIHVAINCFLAKNKKQTILQLIKSALFMGVFVLCTRVVPFYAMLFFIAVRRLRFDCVDKAKLSYDEIEQRSSKREKAICLAKGIFYMVCVLAMEMCVIPMCYTYIRIFIMTWIA